jgi:hypothetical protein
MMTRRTKWTTAAVACGLGLAAIPVAASDPVGVYCVVQRVVMAPDEQHPTSVQVWGACAAANGGVAEDGSYTPGWYAAPRKGYLYYSAPKGKEDICLREWTDLKRVAGTGEVVGFGSRRLNNGRLRLAAELPKDPDAYPIQMGVVRLGHAQSDDRFRSGYHDLAAALKQAAGAR